MNELLPYLVPHLIVTAVTMLVVWRLRDKMQAVVEGLIVLAVPVFGFLIVVGFHLASKIMNLEVKKEPERLKKPEALNLDNLRTNEDVVPLFDGYLLGNDQKKRQFFTDAIKQDIVVNQGILKSAIHDEDREMSYYAVSMLTTRMETLETELFRVEQELEELDAPERADERLAKKKEYADLLAEYIAHEDFVDHVTYRRKQSRYLEILLELATACPDEEKYYRAAEKELLSIHDYERAEKLCADYARAFPESESPYLMYIALYQEMHDRPRLMQKIDELKRSPLRLSKQALEIIRYWGEA